VRDETRRIVGELSPEENALVNSLYRFGDAEISGVLSRRRRGRVEALGFGWEQASELLAPVVWLTLSEAARQFGTRAGDGIAAGLKRLLAKLLGREPKAIPPLVVPLSSEQLARVREIAIRTCRQRKIRDSRGLEIANAIVAALATAYPPGDGSGQ
jgi:hypothetical protein